MCDPATLFVASQAATSALGEVGAGQQRGAEEDAHRLATDRAEEQSVRQMRALRLRQKAERVSTGEELRNILDEATRAEGAVVVSSVESGVVGQGLIDALTEIKRNQSEATLSRLRTGESQDEAFEAQAEDIRERQYDVMLQTLPTTPGFNILNPLASGVSSYFHAETFGPSSDAS